jgi:pyruvate dehydrogenase E2 component (dihydrolipoamide acetyltransferase)
MGVDLAALTGSGPHGRVIRADVLASADAPQTNGEPAHAPETNKGGVSVQKLTRTQRTVARRMAESRATVPEFELRNEFDMSALVAARGQLLAATVKPPSYNDFIVKAAALALREFPRINGSYRDGAFETYDRVNIGIAVASEESLVVPTIFDADVKTVTMIGAEAAALAAKVRDGSITPAELSGATFTVSNLGMYGVDSFSAVIDAPQAAILAVGALKPRPAVAQDGVALVARPTIHVSLACDHRIVYGADGARFLQRLGELLAAPVVLLL